VRSEEKEEERGKREKAKGKSRERGQGVVNFEHSGTDGEELHRRSDHCASTSS
jgi:hypothetical protein